MYTLSSQYCYELTFDAKVGPVKNMSVYFYYTKIVRRQKMNAQAFSLHADALQILQRNGILSPKLFWLTVRKTEGREFDFFLRSLEQFIQTVKGQDNFWFFTETESGELGQKLDFSALFSEIYYFDSGLLASSMGEQI